MIAKTNSNNYLLYFIYAIFLFFIFNSYSIYAAGDVAAPPANAAPDVITKGLCNLIYVFGGGIGRAVGILALSGLGFTVISGQIKMQTFLTYTIGVFLIITPAQIYSFVVMQSVDLTSGERNTYVECGTKKY